MDLTPFVHRSVSADWARALQKVAVLAGAGGMTLPALLDDISETYASGTALSGADEQLSYSQLVWRKNQYARWALAHGIGRGTVVALMMHNCPDYVAIWLGIVQVGGVVALINTSATGDVLAHALSVVSPRHIILGSEFVTVASGVSGQIPAGAACWAPACAAQSGAGMQGFARDAFSGHPLTPAERGAGALGDIALFIFTSGTTGLPKAAKVSHYRVLEWSLWFSGMMGITPADRLYNCLPLYHSTGGVVAVGAVLASGATLIIRERFSASRFWADVVGQDCTLLIYIGELCRYLLHAAPDPQEATHRLRLCFGNGLRAEVWGAFAARFNIPRIIEFYASTEGNVALYNCEGEPGAIGRVPAFLAHRFPIALLALDQDTGEPLRRADGLCVPCGPDELGEAVGKITTASQAGLGVFEGYTHADATQKKILRDVLAPGDAWYRTGDLMRRDRAGFYYFADRLGDTFRWKGENVSTTQLEAVIGACTGVTGAVVYGVAVPGTEGRAGMAAITTGPGFSLAALHAELAARLARYARPVFLRICDSLATTGTFKPIKTVLVREGFCPANGDVVYFDNPAAAGLTKLDAATRAQILQGALRL